MEKIALRGSLRGKRPLNENILNIHGRRGD